VEGKPHHVVVVAVDGFYTNITNPFLDAVGPGLVERAEMLYIEFYFGRSQAVEFNLCGFLECFYPTCMHNGDTGHNFMCVPR